MLAIRYITTGGLVISGIIIVYLIALNVSKSDVKLYLPVLPMQLMGSSEEYLRDDKMRVYLKGFDDGWFSTVDEGSSIFHEQMDYLCPSLKDDVEIIIEPDQSKRKPRPLIGRNSEERIMAEQIEGSDVVITSFRHLAEIDDQFMQMTQDKVNVIFTYEPPAITLDLLRLQMRDMNIWDHRLDDMADFYGQQGTALAKGFLDNYFNYDFTYSPDSDYSLPYYQWKKSRKHYLDSNSPALRPVADDFVSGKKRLAMAFVSNCKSNWADPYRHNYLLRMKKSLGDSFLFLGQCGTDLPDNLRNMEPGQRRIPFEDLEPISNSKFYFAFENSRCPQYITEKLWANTFPNGVVPVVAGPARSDYEKLIPKDSFIHVDDFASPEDLAAHLQFLDQNDEEYLKYFEWKERTAEGQHGVDHIQRNFQDTKTKGICSLVQDWQQKKLDTRRPGNFLTKLLKDYDSCAHKFNSLRQITKFLKLDTISSAITQLL